MTGLPDIPAADDMRASDADRERIAQVLHQAMGEGRLTLAELDERLAAVYAAKTVAELAPVVRDLPAGQRSVVAAPVVPATGSRVGGDPTSTSAVVVLSGARRVGRWVLPRRFRSVAVLGGVQLDLRDARFATPEATISVVAVLGGVEIVVPGDVTVVVDGVGLLGAFDQDHEREAVPGAPVLRVTGVAVLGGVAVRRSATV